MDKLFTVKEVKRFFSILDRLERSQCDWYLGYDKLNPDSKPCQREVFVNRTIGKWFKNRYFKQIELVGTGFFINKGNRDSYHYEREEFKMEQLRYIKTAKPCFYYGYTDAITVNVADTSNPSSTNCSLKIEHNDALRLVAEEITKEQYYDIRKLFTVDKIKCSSCDDSVNHCDITSGEVVECNKCHEKRIMDEFDAKLDKRMKENSK